MLHSKDPKREQRRRENTKNTHTKNISHDIFKDKQVKKVQSTQMKNADHYNSCRNSVSVEYLHETKHEKPTSDCKQQCHLHPTVH